MSCITLTLLPYKASKIPRVGSATRPPPAEGGHSTSADKVDGRVTEDIPANSNLLQTRLFARTG